MTKYDDASWHYVSAAEFNPAADEEAIWRLAATHIGVFLAWALLHDLASEELREDSADEIAAVQTRTMTGAQFLMNACDGKFLDEDLNEMGQAFAEFYFNGGYLDDFFVDDRDESYKVPDTWETYDRMEPVIDQRFAAWQAAPPARR